MAEQSKPVKLYRNVDGGSSNFCIVFLSILIGLLWINYSRRNKGSAPGPFLKIPFLGHLESLLGGSDLVKKSANLRRKYGDIFSYNIIGMNTVHLCSFELINSALKKREVSSRIPFQKFSNISKVISDIYIHGLHGIVVTEGKEWQEQRRFCFKTLKNFGFGKSSMESIMHEEVINFSEQLRSESKNGPVDLANRFNVMVINVLWRIIGGKRFDYKDEKFAELVGHLNEGFSAIAPTPRLAFLFAFPFLKDWAPKLTGFENIQRGYHGVYEFLKGEIKSHQENLDLDNPKDFIDAYLIEMKKKKDNEDTSSSFYEEMGIECLFCVLHDLFLAGSETSSTFLLWSIIFLMRNPESQARIHAELDAVVEPERLAGIEDQSETPFTLAFIDEVHRMASHVPLAVQHWTSEDVEVGGFVIPADSIIIPNISEVHHDPKTWGDPEVFRPERFLDNNGQFVKNERVIPYSIGARRCPGESLAKSEIYLFLTGLLKNFSFHIPHQEEGPSLDYNFGFTLLPKAFKVDIVPR
jgi:cytochrome P450